MRENVILILADDTPKGMYDMMPYLQTRPQGKWVRFPNFVHQSPVCRVSRASLLTGRYAHNHGLLTNNVNADGVAWYAAKKFDVLPAWLAKLNYYPSVIGKMLNGYPWSGQGGPGFTDRPSWAWRWFANGGNSYGAWNAANDGAQFTSDGSDNWTGVGYDETARTARQAATGFLTDRLSKELTTTVAACPEPFFAWVGHGAPHDNTSGALPKFASRHSNVSISPNRAPSFNEADTSDKPAWHRAAHPTVYDSTTEGVLDGSQTGSFRSVLALDESLYDLITVLNNAGRLDRTIIIVCGDNGFANGENRIWAKDNAYEPSLVGECWIRHPSATNRTDNAIVSTVDIAPTAMAVAGGRARSFDGMSLLPRILDGSAPWRTEAFAEFFTETSTEPSWSALRSAGSKYVAYDALTGIPAEDEHYDLSTDPYELQNLGADTALATRLAVLRRG